MSDMPKRFKKRFKKAEKKFGKGKFNLDQVFTLNEMIDIAYPKKRKK